MTQQKHTFFSETIIPLTHYTYFRLHNTLNNKIGPGAYDYAKEMTNEKI